jgi:hypothetical protein
MLALSRHDAKAETYLERTRDWEALLNDAYASGTPIVAEPSIKRGRQERVLRITGQIMLRDEFVFDAAGAPALPEVRSLDIDGKSYLYLAKGEQSDDAVRSAIARRCAVFVSISAGLFKVTKASLPPACSGGR